MNNILIWSIQISEESCGHYIARCVSDMGHVVEYNGGEEVEQRIIEGIFGIGSLISGSDKAAMGTIISFNRSSQHEYHEDALGSWRIQLKNEMLAFDGRSGWLNYIRDGQVVKIMNWRKDVKFSDLLYLVRTFNRAR